MSFSGKRILFISASFFSYEKAIIQLLEKLGASVDFFDERPSNSVFSKGIIRVNRKFYQQKINQYYQSISEKTTGEKYDFFLLIKGESVPEKFLENFKNQHSETQMIFYLYDSVKEYPRFLDLLPYFDKKITFEPSDAKKYQLQFRPLFFIDDYVSESKKENLKYDLVFIGSAHTDRFLVGEKVEEKARILGFKTLMYYFAPSKTALKLRQIFDKNLQKINLKKVTFKNLTHLEISKIYSETKAVLDINKPFQFGLTMRTFETLASEKKLITTNPEIKNYPFYHPQNILVIDRNSVELEPSFFQSEFQKIDEEDLYKMSLTSWLQEVFLLNDDSYWKKCLP